MASLIRLHYDPLPTLNVSSIMRSNVRARPSPSSRVNPATATNAQYLDSLRPRMDVKESEDTNAVTATFELPGLRPEDITIELQQNLLTVSGKSEDSDSRELNGYTVRERRYGKFSRTLQLPFGTKPEDITTKLENGLLTVTFPKTVPVQQPQRIAIQ